MITFGANKSVERKSYECVIDSFVVVGFVFVEPNLKIGAVRRKTLRKQMNGSHLGETNGILLEHINTSSPFVWRTFAEYVANVATGNNL